MTTADGRLEPVVGQSLDLQDTPELAAAGEIVMATDTDDLQHSDGRDLSGR
jgi:hypothetical protein